MSTPLSVRIEGLFSQDAFPRVPNVSAQAPGSQARLVVSSALAATPGPAWLPGLLHRPHLHGLGSPSDTQGQSRKCSSSREHGVLSQPSARPAEARSQGSGSWRCCGRRHVCVWEGGTETRPSYRAGREDSTSTLTPPPPDTHSNPRREERSGPFHRWQQRGESFCPVPLSGHPWS